MRPEMVVFGNSTPVCVDNAGSPLGRTHSIHPMVGVSGTTTRPAQIRDSDVSKGVDNVLPNTSDSKDWRVFSNPDLTIDAVTQVFGKMPIQMAADGVSALIGVDDQSIHRVAIGVILRTQE